MICRFGVYDIWNLHTPSPEKTESCRPRILNPPAKMNPETIKSCVPYLYTVAIDLIPSRCRSSYAMKHDVEHLLDQYVSNDELKSALADMMYYRGGSPTDNNLYFAVKPKFDLHWLRSPPKTRPKGARKTHWEAYQTALEWAKAPRASPAEPNPPCSEPPIA